MPPLTPRAPLRALANLLRPSTTTKTTTTTPFLRALSTTAPLTVELPPESPHWVRLPAMPQNDEPRLPPVKGILPTPRRIFSKRAHGKHKLSRRFIPNTAPLSTREQQGLPPKSDRDAWKRRIAASRRAALDTGRWALYERRRDREMTRTSVQNARAARNLRAKKAPERDDEVFTRGTVSQAVLQTRVDRDPEYAARQAESARRTAGLEEARRLARRDAVQRLYVEAGRFILTEAELAKAVNAAFAEDRFFKAGMGLSNWNASNVWQGYGKPMKVADMFSSMRGKMAHPTDATGGKRESKDSRTVQRQKIIAGELTGGALSVSHTS